MAIGTITRTGSSLRRVPLGIRRASSAGVQRAPLQVLLRK